MISILYKKLKTFLLLIVLLIFILFPSTVFAQQNRTGGSYNNTSPISVNEQALVDSLKNSSCPDFIKNFYLEQDSSGNYKLQDGVKIGLHGTLIYGYNLDSNGQKTKPIALSCASAGTLEKLVVRLIMVLFSIIGLVLAYAIGKAAIMMITSMGDSEKFQEAVKGLVNAIMYTVGFLFFYTIFVFVAVGVLGVGQIKQENGARYEYNLFCQNRIIFNLTFDQSQPCN